MVHGVGEPGLWTVGKNIFLSARPSIRRFGLRWFEDMNVFICFFDVIFTRKVCHGEDDVKDNTRYVHVLYLGEPEV